MRERELYQIQHHEVDAGKRVTLRKAYEGFQAGTRGRLTGNQGLHLRTLVTYHQVDFSEKAPYNTRWIPRSLLDYKRV